MKIFVKTKSFKLSFFSECFIQTIIHICSHFVTTYTHPVFISICDGIDNDKRDVWVTHIYLAKTYPGIRFARGICFACYIGIKYLPTTLKSYWPGLKTKTFKLNCDHHKTHTCIHMCLCTCECMWMWHTPFLCLRVRMLKVGVWKWFWSWSGSSEWS